MVTTTLESADVVPIELSELTVAAESTEMTSTSTPGFGVAVALVALLAAALLAGRRE